MRILKLMTNSVLAPMLTTSCGNVSATNCEGDTPGAPKEPTLVTSVSQKKLGENYPDCLLGTVQRARPC